MDKETENKTFYNNLYKKKNPFFGLIHTLISFDQQSKSKINYSTLVNYLKNRDNTQLSILDYGFGHGSLLLKFKKTHLLYGCDISDEAVENFSKIAEIVGIRAKTIRVSDFTEKTANLKFDVIILSHILEHVENDEGLLKTLVERLNTDGVILINLPINEVWEDPKHVRKYTIDDVKKLLNKCNLELVFSVETDRVTSFFLKQERAKKPLLIRTIFIKLLRLIFALLPMKFIYMLEKLFFKDHEFQQLIVLAKKS